MRANSAQAGTVPSGTVAFFNLASCPAGWSELTAARGRYLVGKLPGGTLGGTIGTALTDLQNRDVGRHLHGIAAVDPGHLHNTTFSTGTADAATATPNAPFDVASTATSSSTGFSSVQTTQISGTDNTGSTFGTTAPYLQLLVCQKN